LVWKGWVMVLEPGSGGMRAVKFAASVMGVLILAGTAVLVAVLFKRASVSGTAVESATLLPIPGETVAAEISAILDEPAGTRIAGITAMRDRIAIQLQGGGPDRIVLIDPRTGAKTGRIALAR